MSRVGFVTHPGRSVAVETAEELQAWLQVQGADTVVLPGDGSLPADGEAVDLVVSVGGDGTFLRAAYAASDLGCPVLGVKVGRMGFLTEVEPSGATELISAVLAGTARIERADGLTVEPLEGVRLPAAVGA